MKNFISKSKDFNPNYLCKVITVKGLRKHTNADKLNVFTVDGNDIITGINTPEDQVSIYFPLECQILHDLISKNNDYRKATSDTSSTYGLNIDPESSGGFFDQNGRVKAVKLRGQKSEGYVIPIEYFSCIINDVSKFNDYIDEEFDTVNDIQVVKKYVTLNKNLKGMPGQPKSKKVSNLIENQFRLHYDTSQLGKNLHKIRPESIISISWKFHGTSFVSSKILCTRKLNFFERILKKLGVKIRDAEYSNIYSSRKVIKNDDINKNPSHYYGYDLWKSVNDIFKENLHAGETIYGEVVGFTKEGGYIQKGFDYKCEPNKKDVYVYRITQTSAEGKVIDLPFNMVMERCDQLNVKHVPLIFFGTAKDFFSNNYNGTNNQIPDEEWQGLLFERIKKDYVYDQNSQFCNKKVPEEGVVLRIEGLKAEAFKLKAFKFLEYETKELDKGEENIEDNQTDS